MSEVPIGERETRSRVKFHLSPGHAKFTNRAELFSLSKVQKDLALNSLGMFLYTDNCLFIGLLGCSHHAIHSLALLTLLTHKATLHFASIALHTRVVTK